MNLTIVVLAKFNNQPDQIARIIGSDPSNILYFCEVSL
jgi:hypothetical protein